MIYCPNKLQIYASYLRLLYQNIIIKKGINKNITEKIKKIHEFECINGTYETMPLNVEKYSAQIFTAVIFKKNFDYKINVNGNRLVNKKVFTSLLLNICQYTNFLEIKQINKSVVISGKINKTKSIRRLIQKLNGTVYTEINSETVYIKFDFPQTSKKSADFETAYYMLQNPLSPINIYLPD